MESLAASRAEQRAAPRLEPPKCVLLVGESCDIFPVNVMNKVIPITWSSQRYSVDNNLSSWNFLYIPGPRRITFNVYFVG